jgi:hypothetical protein
MTDRQFRSIRRLLLGLTASIALLAGALLGGASVPEARAEGESRWTCMVGDRLAEPTEAEDWKGARQASRALDAVGKHVPTGTVTAFHLGNSDTPMVVCIK